MISTKVKKAPTYQDLISGTASLEHCIALNEDFKKTSVFNVDLPRIELGSGQCECPVLPLNHRPLNNTTNFK